MAMTGGSSKGIKNDINVTPLVDVVLVLLIIFMVITPMLQRGKGVKLPDAKNLTDPPPAKDPAHPSEPTFIAVTKDGKWWIDKSETTKEKFIDALKAELEKNHGQLVLKADKEVLYKPVREMIL